MLYEVITLNYTDESFVSQRNTFNYRFNCFIFHVRSLNSTLKVINNW